MDKETAEQSNQLVESVFAMKREEGFETFMSVVGDIDLEDISNVTEAILGEMFFDK